MTRNRLSDLGSVKMLELLDRSGRLRLLAEHSADEAPAVKMLNLADSMQAKAFTFAPDISTDMLVVAHPSARAE